jgi:hypothetical protein
MALLGALFRGMDWWTLKPDVDGRFLIDDEGDEQAVAAVTCDRSHAVVYVPSEREIVLDLAQLEGDTVALSWYDPTNGQVTPADQALPAAGTRVVATPGANGEGSDDWVLLIDASPPGG